MAKKKKGKKVAQKQGVDLTVQKPDGPFWRDDRIARILRFFVTGALGAAVLNLALWILSLGLFAVNPQVITPGADAPEALQPMAVLLASALPALGAAIVYHFVDQSMGKHAWGTFRMVAIVLAILSLIPVWIMSVSTGSKIVLSLMHIASAVGILWGIRYTLNYFPEAIGQWAEA